MRWELARYRAKGSPQPASRSLKMADAANIRGSAAQANGSAGYSRSLDPSVRSWFLVGGPVMVRAEIAGINVDAHALVLIEGLLISSCVNIMTGRT